MASEGELGRKWDRCLADSAVKLGKGGEGRAEGEDPGRSGSSWPGAPGLGGPPSAWLRGVAGPGEEGPGEGRCPPPLRAWCRSAAASPRCGPGRGGLRLRPQRRAALVPGVGEWGGGREPGGPGPGKVTLAAGTGPAGPAPTAAPGLFSLARPRLTHDPVAEGRF